MEICKYCVHNEADRNIILSDGEIVDACQYCIFEAMIEHSGNIHEIINLETDEVISL
jgi:hypothetical protein